MLYEVITLGSGEADEDFVPVDEESDALNLFEEEDLIDDSEMPFDELITDEEEELPEDVTLDDLVDFEEPLEAPGSPFGSDGPDDETRPRITSYNVCYTKLLRSAPARAFFMLASTPFAEPTGIFGSIPPWNKAQLPFWSGVLTQRRTLSSVITSYSIHYTKLYEIGLNIGADTPNEIALSIVGELVQVRSDIIFE